MRSPAPRSEPARHRPRDAPGLAGRLLVALGVAVLLLALDARFGGSGVLGPLELQTLDWRFRLRGPEQPGGEVVLVLADDATVAELGAWPPPRAVLAEAVRRLADAGAGVIAVNLLLAESQTTMPAATRRLLEDVSRALPPTASNLRQELTRALGASGPDQALAEAFTAAGNTVLPYAFVLDPAQVNTTGLPAWIRATAYRIQTASSGLASQSPLTPLGAIVPADALGAAAASAGHVSLLLEADGTLRADLPAVAFDDDLYPSLAVEVARLHLGVPREKVTAEGDRLIRIGDRQLPLDQAGHQLVDHYGPEATLPTHSLASLLRGKLDPAAVAGRVVVLGASAAGAGDRFATPFTGRLPGSEFLATAIDNILTGRTPRRDAATRAVDALATVLMAVAAALLAGRRSPLVSLLAVLVLVGSWAATLQFAFSTARVWLAALAPSAAALLAGVGVEALRLVDERRRRRRFERQRANLARYFAPAVVDRLAASDNPTELDRTQEAVVMFIDIVGFTQLSERMTPAAAMDLLRGFHTLVERAMFDHGGMVDAFLGDGAKACFGVPDPSASAGADAVHGALALFDALALTPPDGWRLQVSIGVHRGPVLMGDIGGATQFQFAVIGDTVNVASRLEALTRQHDTPLIVSEQAMAAARASLDHALLARFAPLPDLPIRGRQGRIGAWRLVDRQP